MCKVGILMGKRAGAYASAIAVAALMLLSSSLVLSAGSASAYQEGEFSFTLDGSPAVATITGYSGPGGSVVIPDHIGGQSVAHLGEGAFQAVNSITSVVIPDSVLTIGASAFSGCSALTSVTIGAAVTTVGDHAFSGCAALTSVTVGGSVTSLGDGAFQD